MFENIFKILLFLKRIIIPVTLYLLFFSPLVLAYDVKLHLYNWNFNSPNYNNPIEKKLDDVIYMSKSYENSDNYMLDSCKVTMWSDGKKIDFPFYNFNTSICAKDIWQGHFSVDPGRLAPGKTYDINLEGDFWNRWSLKHEFANDWRKLKVKPLLGSVTRLDYNATGNKVRNYLLLTPGNKIFFSGSVDGSTNGVSFYFQNENGSEIGRQAIWAPDIHLPNEILMPQPEVFKPGLYKAIVDLGYLKTYFEALYSKNIHNTTIRVVDKLPSLSLRNYELPGVINTKKNSMAITVDIKDYLPGLDNYIDKMVTSVDGIPGKSKVVANPTSKTFTATVDTSGIWYPGVIRTLRICMDLGNNRTRCDYHVVQYNGVKPEANWSGKYKNGQTIYTNQGDVKLTLAVKDHSETGIKSGQLSYRAQGGSWQYMPLQDGGTQWSATPRLNPGVLYEFQAQVTDADGMKSDWTPSTYVGFDNTPPTVSWSGDNYANKTRWVNNPRVIVSVNSRDSFSGVKRGELRYSPYNNGGLQQWKTARLIGSGNYWQAELMLEPVGRAYEIQAQAEDVAGNLSPWTEHQQATFIDIDNIAPTVAWAGDIKPGKTHWLTHADVSLMMTATDAASGVAKGSLSWTNDNGVSWQYKTAKQTGNQWGEKVTLSPGLTYRFTLNATDKAGNASKWLPESRVIYKNDKPVIFWDKDRPLSLVDKNIEVKGRVTDSQQDKLVTVIQWQEVGASSWQTSQPVTLDANGFFTTPLRGLDLTKSWMLHISSTDIAGNLVSSDNKYLTPLFKDADLSLSQCDDLDHSNGCTPGDTLRLKLSVSAASDVRGMMAQVTLPAGLSSIGRPVLDAENTHLHPDNASKVSASLNLDWTGVADQTDIFRVKEGTPVLEKGEKFTLLLPVRIDEKAQGTLTSQALLGSSADVLGQLKREVPLKLQTDNFPLAQALHLEIASPEVNNGETVISTQAFNYCLSLRAGKWGLSGGQLQYLLPGGLRATAAPSFSHKSDIKQGLNKNWNGGDSKQLLDANVALKPNERLLLRIPVQLTSAGTKQSSVTAGARSVNGEKTVTHCVFGENLDFMGKSSCISTLPSVAFTEKDMDCRQ